MEINDGERIMALPDPVGAPTPGEPPDGAKQGDYDEQTSTVDDACLDEEDSDDGGSQMGGYRMETDSIKESNVGDTDDGKKGNSSANFPRETGSYRSRSRKETMEKRPPPIPAKNNGNDGLGCDGEPMLGFRAQYHVIRAAKTRQVSGASLSPIAGYVRGEDSSKSNAQGFDVEGDTRQYGAKNFHDTTGCRNISSSFENEGLTCLACTGTHDFLEQIASGEPIVIFATDQNFPPLLPTVDGRCVAIVRVEDGRLFEIEKTFKEILAEFVAPHGRLPVGSVVLIGSLSHLGTFGLESYANDLVKTISSLLAVVGQGVNVVPSVPVPLGGIDDPVTIRALFDLDSWLKADTGLTLGGAREFFWGTVAANGECGGASSNGERRYHLPGGYRNPRKKPYRSLAVNPALPDKIPPLDEKGEKELVGIILSEICREFGVKVNTNPIIERGMATPAKITDGGRIVLIGASHMCRTAEQLPDCISLAMPGFKPSPDNLREIERKIRRIDPDERDLVVMDLISNVAYMGTDEDGLPSPAVRSGDGTYHITGSLTTAPPTKIKKALECCAPLAGILKKTRVLLICPIPRYVASKCCTDPMHIENFNSSEYDDELLECQDQHRRLLGTWGATVGLNFEICDPTSVVNNTEPMLRHRTTSTGSLLWCATDGVHMTVDAYADLAHAIMEASEGGVDGDAASCSSGSSKRKLPDSVITLPLPGPGAPKRSRLHGPVRPAGWLRGIPEKRAIGGSWRGKPMRGNWDRGGRGGRGGGSAARPGRSGWRRMARW